jgi:hypothetical protein
MITRSHRTGLYVVLGALLLVACGGSSPGGPTATAPEGDFPIVSTYCTPIGSGPTQLLAAQYMVLGLSQRVVDPNATVPLEARLRVGEVTELWLSQGPPPGSGESCGSHRSEAWTSTDPSVATLERGDYSFVARVRALRPGTFTVFVDFTASDDARHRTTLAYCQGETGFSFQTCNNPKRIGVVTVVP